MYAIDEPVNYPKTGSGNDFRIWKYGQWDPFIHARDLGGLGIMDPGLGGKDGAMTGRGFDASGNTDSSGMGGGASTGSDHPSPSRVARKHPLA
jgi:hypothetical protein